MSYSSPAEGFSLEELAKSLTSNFVLLTQEGNSNAWKYKSGVIISWLKNLCLMHKNIGLRSWGSEFGVRVVVGGLYIRTLITNLLINSL